MRALFLINRHSDVINRCCCVLWGFISSIYYMSVCVGQEGCRKLEINKATIFGAFGLVNRGGESEGGFSIHEYVVNNML